MRQYLLNDNWIFDAGNYLGRAATGPALLNVDVEHAPQPLRLGHHSLAVLGSSVEWILRIKALKQEIARLKKFEVRMLAAPDEQISLSDPDARTR